jgi:putative ABC transport system permease protein
LNTMTMNILERTRELGMLRALGSLRRQVVRMVLAEALVIGVVSALYGIVFGYILSRVLVTVANLISGYDLQYAFSARPYLISLLIALGVSQLATLAPARRAARVNITQALKNE